jgi:death on curing protein
MTAEVRYLTLDQVIAGARHILGDDAKLRDPGLLDSALHRPSTVAFGVEAYPTFHGKAAALLHSMVMNHPYLDGNKRMGWAVTEAFYRLNGWRYRGPRHDDEAFALVMDVAQGLGEVDAIADRLARLFHEVPGDLRRTRPAAS